MFPTKFISYLCDIYAGEDREKAYEMYRRLTRLYCQLTSPIRNPVLRFQSGCKLLEQLHTGPLITRERLVIKTCPITRERLNIGSKESFYLYLVRDFRRANVLLALPYLTSSVARGLMLFSYGFVNRQPGFHFNPSFCTEDTLMRVIAWIGKYDHKIRTFGITLGVNYEDYM